jgi:hypothetical protein
LGTFAADTLKNVLTSEQNKPPTKGDILWLANKKDVEFLSGQADLNG